MTRLRPSRPTAGLVVSIIALIVALGGTSYAAFTLPKDSVGTKQLKKSAITGNKIAKNAVGGVKIANNAVTSAKVKDGSLLAADFKAGQLPAGAQGPKGDPGAQGPKGDPGAKGAKGDPGATTVIMRQGALGSLAGPGGSSSSSATCQPGETLVGGGAGVSSFGPAKPTLTGSSPGGSTWFVDYRNDGASGNIQAVATALCASP
jgi:hypothetical protein